MQEGVLDLLAFGHAVGFGGGLGGLGGDAEGVGGSRLGERAEEGESPCEHRAN